MKMIPPSGGFPYEDHGYRLRRRPYRRGHFIDSRKADVVTAEICRLVQDHGVTELVLGYPKNMDGTLGPRAEKCAAYADTLREATGLSVTLWDERRSTVEAHAILFNNGKNGKQRKKTVDAVAASLILEGYLTRKRLEKQA